MFDNLISFLSFSLVKVCRSFCSEKKDGGGEEKKGGEGKKRKGHNKMWDNSVLGILTFPVKNDVVICYSLISCVKHVSNKFLLLVESI